jgi:DNA invertase Pin-like site-specific DNA recombinase
MEDGMKQQARVAIYIRVSTADQSCAGQEHDLKEYAKNRAWKLERIYSDRISGVKSSRPALDAMLTDAKKRKFDRLLVWRIDRLGRSVSHLLEVLETLRALGIEFISLGEAIDTATPTGKMVFTVLGAVAELERSITVERVRMGLENARRKGVRLGRPALKKLDKAEIAKIRAERLKGATLRQIAKAHGASLWSVHQVCK